MLLLVARSALLIILLGVGLAASADRNLEICLSGKYPALCKHTALTEDQLQRVRAAERRENLAVCLTGKYPALCRHAQLTPEEAARVREAERLQNLSTCLSGKYPVICKRNLLSPDEFSRVRAAEAAENLKICLDGRYPVLCKHDQLTAEQLKAARSAESEAAATRPTRVTRRPPRSGRSPCESGHWIEEVSSDGKLVKLEDGSLWEVDDVDTVTTSIWLPVSEVVVCGTTMINTDDDESVSVSPLRSSPSLGSTSKRTYAVDASAGDETFVINGEVFKAKTYCFNIEKGDRVVFIEGSPLGACASAKIVNLRTEKACELWCE